MQNDPLETATPTVVGQEPETNTAQTVPLGVEQIITTPSLTVQQPNLLPQDVSSPPTVPLEESNALNASNNVVLTTGNLLDRTVIKPEEAENEWKEPVRRRIRKQLVDTFKIVLLLLIAFGFGVIGVTLVANSHSKSATPSTTVQIIDKSIPNTTGAGQNPNQKITINYPTTVSKDLTVNGLTKLQSLQINGSVSIQGSFNVNGTGTFTNNLTAASFTGDGANLTNVDATSLGGHPASFYTQLNNLTGTLDISHISPAVAVVNGNNAFTGANTFAGTSSYSGATLFTGSNTFSGSTSMASLLLAQPLAISSGGTGITSVPIGGVLYGQGNDSFAIATAAGAGLCLQSTNAGVAFGNCLNATGIGVASLDGLTNNLTIANSSGNVLSGVISVNDATTASKGIASFNVTDFTVTSGAVDTVQPIATNSSPTFNGLTLSTALAVTSGGTGSTTAAGARTNLGAAASGANADISSLTGLSAITPTSALTVGAIGQTLTLQGGASTKLTATNGVNTTQLAFATPTANHTILLPNAGGTVAVSASGNIALDGLGNISFTGTLGVVNGGTGSTTTSGARTNLGAAASGANSDITSLTGITTALSLIQGGTGAVDAAGARSNLGAAAKGANSDITSLSGLTTALSVAQGGTGSTTTSGARTNLGAAASGANSDITSISGLTTALSVLQGGTGASTLGANGVLVGNGTSAITSIVAGSNGLCLISGAGGPTWQACTGAAGVTSVNSQVGALTVTGTTNEILVTTTGTTITLSTPQDIAVTSSPTFAGLTLTTALSVANGGTGSTTASGARTTLGAAASGANSDITSITGLSTALSVTQGGSGATTAATARTNLGAAASGTNGDITGLTALTSITPAAALTIGSTAQTLTLQGSATTKLTATNGANTTQLAFATPTANHTITLPNAGGTVAVSASGNIALDSLGNVSFTGTLGVLNGGTGATTAAGARTSLGAAASGANSDITSLSGLTTALSLIQGGTGATDASGARSNIGAAASGANSDITSISGLSTALSITQGGTGASTLGANGVLVGNGTSAITSIVAGSNGLCLISTVSGPAWQTCTGAGGVSSVNSQSGALTIVGTSNQIMVSTAGTTITLAAPQDIAVTSSPTFAALTLTSALAVTNGGTGATTASGARTNLGAAASGANNDITSISGLTTALSISQGGTGTTSAGAARTSLGAAASGANSDITSLTGLTNINNSSNLTVGNTGKALTLQGSATTITNTSGGFTTSVGFAAPTANVTYLFQSAAGGTYNICTTAGNCSGVGGSVTTSGGTTGNLALFSGSQAIGDSVVSQSGTTVTVGGTLAVNTVTPSATFLLGATTQGTTLQGTTVAIKANSGGNTNTLSFATPSGASHTVTVPNANGTVAVSASGPLSIDAVGNITCASCVTSGGGGGGASSVDSIDSLTGAIVLQGTTNQIAVTNGSGTITFSLPQDINTSSSPTFSSLTLTGGLAVTGGITAGSLGVTGAVTAASFNAITLTPNATGFSFAGGTTSKTLTVSANSTIDQNLATTASPTFTALSLTTALSVANGGTGSTTAAGARTNLGAAASGANNDITSISGLTTALSVAQGGSGATTAGGARTNLGAAASGTNADITALTGLTSISPGAALTVGSTGQSLILQGSATTKLTATSGASTTQLAFAVPTGNHTITLPDAGGTVAVSASGNIALSASGNITFTGTLGVLNGGTGATDASGARSNIGAAASGANSDITSISGLSTALSITQGGTGASTLGANGVLVGNGTSAITSIVAGSNGLCLISTVSGPAWQTCTGAGGVSSVNSQSGALTIVGTSNQIMVSTAGTTITLAAPQDIAVTSSPTFAGLTLTTALSVTNGGTGSSTAAGARTNLGAAASGANSDITSITGLTTALSLTQGGSGATTTAAARSNFGAAASGSNGDITSLTALTAITPAAALTIGATGQTLTLQGNTTTKLTATSGGNTSQLVFATPTGARTITLPDASGTVAVSASGNIALSGTGNITFTGTLGVGNGGTGATTSAGARTNFGAAASGANGDITSLSGLTTALSVVQGGTGASTLGANGVLVGNGTSAITSIVAGSNGLCLESSVSGPTWQTCTGAGGVSSVNTATGNLTVAGTNNQVIVTTVGSTITLSAPQDLAVASSPTFAGLTLTTALSVGNGGTGSTTAAGARTNLGAAASGANSDITSLTGLASINNSSNLTIGNTAKTLTLQGSSTTLTANSGGFTTTVGFAAPTANVTYMFQTAAGGTYDICTTAGNCTGVGGGVTTAGGTTGTIALFNGSQTIGNSILTQSGTTVTVGGALAANTITPNAAFLLGATTQGVTLQGTTVAIKSTSGSNTNTLSFATPAGASHTVTVPNANGTVAVSASGPLALDASGNITCASCVTSGGTGGGSAAVDSVNGLTGAITLQGTTNRIAVSNGSGTITFSLPQDINTSSSPTFSALTLSNSLSVTNGVSAGSLAVTGAATAATINGLSLTANAVGFSIAGGTTSKALTVTANATIDQNLATTASPTFAGLTLGTALSVANGGTGSTTASGARTNLGAAASGANADITSLSGLTTALSLAQGGSGATTAAGARTNFGAAASGANSDITSLAGLTTALSVLQGGTGATTLSANGVLVGNGTSAITSIVAGSNGLCLESSVSGPVWQTCSGAGGVSSVNSQNGALTIVGTSNQVSVSTAGTTITLAGPQDLAVTSSPTFAGLTLSTALSIGNGGTGSTTAAGARTSLGAAASGANSDITALTGLTSITPGAALTVGSTTQTLTLQGSATTKLTATSGANTTQLAFATPTSNRTITLPDASGTVAVSASGNIALSAAGDISFTGTLGVGNGGTGSTTAAGARTSLGAATAGANSDVTSLTGLTTALSVAQGGTGTATLTNKGILYGNGTGAVQVTAAGTSGQIFQADGSAIPSFVTFSNDVTVATGGSVTIANGAVTSGKIASGTIADINLNTGTFTHITGVGTLGAGSIGTGFGAISTGNNITTTVALQGATVNATTGYQVGGAAATGNFLRGNGTNFVSSAIQASDIPSGSNNYIQNGTASQTGNFNLQSAGSGNIGGIIKGATGQTADLLQFQNSTGTVLAKVDSSGTLVAAGLFANQSTIGGGTYSSTTQSKINTTAAGNTGLLIQGVGGQTADLFQIQNSTGTVLSGFNASGQLYNQSGTFTGIIAQAGLGQNTTYTLPDPGAGTATICLQGSANCGFAPASGSNNYINNTTTPQTANVNVTGSDSTAPTATFKGATGGTGNTLLIKAGAGDPLQVSNLTGITSYFKVDTNGNTTINKRAFIGTTSDYTATLNVSTQSAGQIGQVVQGVASQSADLLQLRDSGTNTLAKFDANGNLQSYGTNNTITGLAYPTPVTITTAGTAGSTTYGYRVSAVNAQGETIASPTATTATGNATLSAGNYNIVTFNAVAGATSYKVYGRTSGSELFMATVAGTGAASYVYNDSGVATPSGALPTGTFSNAALTLSSGSSASNLLLNVQTTTGATAASIDGFGNFTVRPTGTSPNGSASVKIGTGFTSGTGQIISGVSAQTADLSQSQDFNGSVLSGVTANGAIYSNGTGETIGGLATPVITSPSTVGTNFYYVLTATNAAGETVASNVLAMNANTSVINWTQVPGATGYKVYRNTTNSFTSGTLLRTTITNGRTVTFTDTGAATTGTFPPTAPTGTGLTIQGWNGQTANTLQIQNSSGTVLGGFNAGGQLYSKSGSFTGTIAQAALGQNTTYTLPDPGVASATICLSTGNCSAAGGYIVNGTTQQASSNFNISGAGTIGTNLLVSGYAAIGTGLSLNTALKIATTSTQDGIRILSTSNSPASGNLLINAGAQSGRALTYGANGTLSLVAGGNQTTADLADFQDTNGVTMTKISSSGSLTSYGTNATFNGLATPVITSPSTVGTNFYYVLTATNAAGETVASNVLAMNANTSVINWTQVPGATGYKLYRNSSNSFTSGTLLVATIAVGSTVTFTDTGAATTGTFPPTAPTGTGLTIQGWNGQTANTLQIQNSSGTVLGGFNAGGQLYQKIGSYTGTIAQGTLTQSTVYTIPASTAATDTFCLVTLANCSSALAVGTLDGGTANATGATISGGSLYLQSASTSYAGLVNTSTQTFAGAKTFNNLSVAAPAYNNATFNIGGMLYPSCSFAGCGVTLKSDGGQSIYLDNGSVGQISLTGWVYVSGPTTLQGVQTNVNALIAANTTSATVPVAVLRGGQTPGAGADLLQLKAYTTTVASFNNAGDLIFANNAAHSISLASTASGTGNNLSISAGSGGGTNQNGGNLVLQAGANTGTGTGGSIVLKAFSGQTSDLLDFQNTAGTVLSSFDATGALNLGSSNNTSLNLNQGGINTAYGGIGRSQNLLVYSEQLDNAGWFKINSTVVANNATAPDGTATADTINVTTGGGQVGQGVTVSPATTYTFSWWAKLGTLTSVNYSVYDNTHSANIVNPTAYAATSTGWQRFSTTFTTPTGTTNISVIPLVPAGTGTGYIWGTQLEQASTPGTYIQTVGTAATTTNYGLVVNSAGSSIFNGNVGIGTSNATSALTVTHTETGTIGAAQTYSNYTVTPASAPGSSAIYNGITSVVTASGANLNTNTSLVGVSSNAVNTGASGLTLGGLTGTAGTATNSGTGNVFGASGGSFNIQNTGTGTTSYAQALFAGAPTVSAGSISIESGLYIAAQKVTGVGTAYGVNQVGTSDLNLFAGQTSIQNTSTTALQVQNAAGTSIFTADTTNGQITTKNLNVGSATNLGAAGRLFSDSFESGNLKLWPTVVNAATDTAQVHNGKYALKINGSAAASYLTAPISSSGTVYARAYIYATTNTTSGTPDILSVSNSSSGYGAGVWRDAGGNLNLFWNGGGNSVVLSALPLNQWDKLEMRVIGGTGTAGSITVWVNGTQIGTSGGINTNATTFDTLTVGDGGATTQTFWMDDLAVDTVSPGDSASLNVADTLHVSGTSSFGSNVMLQAATNSTTALQIQNSSAASLFTADTTNMTVVINNPSATSATNTTGTDSFNSGGPGLPAQWTLYRGTGDTTSAVSYNSALAGDLRIVPKTTAALDCFTTNLACDRVLETSPTGDFTAQTKIDTNNGGTSGNNDALGIWTTTDATCTSNCTYLRFEKQQISNTQWKVIVYGETAGTQDNGGSYVWLTSTAMSNSAPVYLKQVRSGSTWTFSYSTDGVTFTNLGTITKAMTMIGTHASIGVYLDTGGADSAFTSGDFDYFNVSQTTNTYATALSVNGDVSLTNGRIIIGGNTICDSTGCGASGGANTTLSNLGTTAINTDLTFASGSTRNINVAQSTSGAGNNLALQAGAAQASGNVNGGNLVLSGGAGNGTGTVGSVIVKNATNSTGTFQVQDASGNQLINVDSVAQQITIGNANGTPAGQLYVGGNFTAGTTVKYSALLDATNGKSPRDIAIQGNYTYIVAGTSKTILTYDNTVPTAPVLVNTFSVGGTSTPFRLVMNGRYGYLSDTGSDNVIRVIDFSNPAAPSLVTTVSTSVNGAVGQEGITVQGRYLYVTMKQGVYLEIFDLANPAAPTRVGYYTGGAASGGTTIGDPAVAAESVDLIAVQGKYAYVSDYVDDKLQIYDVSNPASPVQMSSTHVTGTFNSFTNIAVQGKYLYSGDNNGWYHVIDISNPSSPNQIQFANTGISGNTIQIQGHYMYVAVYYNNVYVYDISNPTAAPVSAGYLPLGTGANNVQSFRVSGRYAYSVSDGNFNNGTAGTYTVYDLGGAYIQQLEAGGITTSTVNVATSASIGGQTTLQGGLTVAGTSAFNGNVGINGNVLLQTSTNTNATFQILDSSSNVAVTVSTNNVSTSATGGNYATNATLRVAKDSGTGRSINASGTINASGADFAEYYHQANPGTLKSAQIVCLTALQTVDDCGASGVITGVVSDNAGFVGNDIYDPANPDNTVAVGMLGQLPVKVNISNGTIKSGDPIGLSGVAGIGAKQTTAGQIIGWAMGDASSDGIITVLVRPQYYTPTGAQNMQGGTDGTYANLNVTGQTNLSDLNVSGNVTLHSLTVIGDASIGGNLAVVGTLTVTGQANFGDIVVSGHFITAGNTPTATALAALGHNATVSVDGNDTSGTITITTGDAGQAAVGQSPAVPAPTAGEMATVAFAKAFGKTPRVIITPGDGASAPLQVYPSLRATDHFTFGLSGTPSPNTTYTFEYFITQ